MEAKASLKLLRVAPRKARLVADQVRGKQAAVALGILQHNPKRRVADAMHKLIQSALANAKENMNLDVDRLYVKTLLVDMGPTLKRIRPRMRGMANQILKRTSRITLVLDEREG